jgi:hypothetical protein
VTDSYFKPGFFTARVFNPILKFLAGRLGLNFRGAQVLSVQGRKSGEWRSIPVNPLTLGAQRYLVAPRGETEWVRNIRVSRTARLSQCVGARGRAVLPRGWRGCIRRGADSDRAAPPGLSGDTFVVHGAKHSDAR